MNEKEEPAVIVVSGEVSKLNRYQSSRSFQNCIKSGKSGIRKMSTNQIEYCTVIIPVYDVFPVCNFIKITMI